ncbi:aminoglycoside phosphotransferase family protein [Zhihengliuella halotolerans]|uniref:Phosphotransferase family enzyme n=1 Tax=Zhihengliuella halotolerans TaxID=370736 RepID=A0A4Q8ABJ0_9MICC|nr:aminoglycoside phosphotransferase family protein [Zhihengliuella halotolerans]RZU60903.1 phosphotransferase family enzyme [Zhihengliuella halotolerans]
MDSPRAAKRWPEERQLAFINAHASRLVASGIGLDPSNYDTLQPTQVQLQHRPGAGISALYALRDGSGHIGLTTEELPAPAPDSDGTLPYTQLHVPGYEVAPQGFDELVVSVWRHPRDPKLPGLAAAAVPERAEVAFGAGDRLTHLETVAYRPLRRAVLRATFAQTEPELTERAIYLKVMRPDLADELVERSRLLAGAGLPVPDVLAHQEDGVAAFRELSGASLSRLIMHDGGTSLDPAELVALLDKMPAAVLDLPHRPAWADRVDRYASAARTALPEAAYRIDELERGVRDALDAADRGPLVPTHGDFYEANLLMDENRLVGLLDVDNVGPGRRADDLACLLGHVAVLPAVDPRYVHINEALDHFGSVFERGCDPRALWGSAAGVGVSLIAGARVPGQVDEWVPAAMGRLEAAERLLARVPG